jgi:hypothetical protein
MVQSFATTTQALYSANNELIAGVNDLFVGDDGNIVLAGITESNPDQLNAVLYACANAAKSVLGEMVLNTNRGLPNFQVIWVGAPNIGIWEAALRNILSAIDGVSDIAEITTQRGYNTNAYNNTQDLLIYTVTIVTEFGTGTFNGAI